MAEHIDELKVLVSNLKILGAVHSGLDFDVSGNTAHFNITVPTSETIEKYIREHAERSFKAMGFSESEVEQIKARLIAQVQKIDLAGQKMQVDIPLDTLEKNVERVASSAITQIETAGANDVVNFATLFIPPLASLKAAGGMPAKVISKIIEKEHPVPKGLFDGQTPVAAETVTDAASATASSIHKLNTLISFYNKLPDTPAWLVKIREKAADVRDGLNDVFFGNAMKALDNLMNAPKVLPLEANLTPPSSFTSLPTATEPAHSSRSIT